MGAVRADEFQLWKQLKGAPAVRAILTCVCVCMCVCMCAVVCLKGTLPSVGGRGGPKLANAIQEGKTDGR